ncbi:MAG: hypothetical protein M3383_10500 [Actinomycetota bacterium]|nr:hypothetical protein [Actinomycetota bacterium]
MSHIAHTPTEPAEIVIRVSGPEDLPRIASVAGLDSAQVPAGPMLVASVGGQIRAAISLEDGAVIADPFHRTSELVDMLRIRSIAIGARSTQAAGAQSTGWRTTGLRLAAASSRRRTGVV